MINKHEKIPKGADWWTIFPVSRGKVTGRTQHFLAVGVSREAYSYRERNKMTKGDGSE